MPYQEIRDQLVDAALVHVAFDGWTDATFVAAVQDSGVDAALARSICPSGGVDLALAYHARGDQMMLERLRAADLSPLRFRDRIALAVRLRLEVVDDKEAVRRGSTLFTLPAYAADGARAIWGTCDLIWNELGDGSDDLNWYTKRGTLSAVYSSTVLFWLGDDSPDHQATWDFLDRRIDNVMQFEKFKSQARNNPLLKPFLAGPEWLASHIRSPQQRDDLPGSIRTDRN